MNCGKWQPAFVGAVMAAVTIASAIAIAQDAGPAEDALLLQTDTALLEGRLLPSDLEDPAFEQYIDWRLLGQAWNEQDASLLADLALGLTEGERVLLRSHRALSAEQLVQWAAQVAAQNRDSRTLQRLAAVAEKNGQLASQVQATQKLLAWIRSESESDTQLPPEQLSPEQLALYLTEVNRIQGAKLLEDREELLAISEILMNQKPGQQRDSQLPPETHGQLAQLAQSALDELPKESPPLSQNAALLKKLSLVTRRGGSRRPDMSGFSGGSHREPSRPQPGGVQRWPTRPQDASTDRWPTRPQDASGYRQPTRPNHPTQHHHSGHIWVGPGGIQPGNNTDRWKKVSLKGFDPWNQPGTLSFEVGPGNQLRNGKFCVEEQCQDSLYLKGAAYDFAGTAGPNTENAFKGYDIVACTQAHRPMTGTIRIWYYNPAPADWFTFGRRGIWVHVTNNLGNKWWCFPTGSNPFD